MTYESIEYKGHTINLDYDNDPTDPREWDNLGTMYYRHRDYTLGDQAIPDHYYNDQGDYTDIEDASTFRDWVEQDTGEHIAIMLPLAVYEHSGITMWVGNKSEGIDAQWDCSQVGWIVATREKICREYNVKRVSKKLLARVEQVLRGEVKTFDTYLTGQVVGYSVDGELCDDSCWGYYDEAQAIADAKGAIDYEIERARKERIAKLKSYIRGGVGINYRFAI